MKKTTSRKRITAVLSAAVITLTAATAAFPQYTLTASAAGTDLYVGYSNKSDNYSTVQAAVNAAASINPSSESQRVSIHIAPGTYREQIIVNTPYISFVNDEPDKEVKLTWYYGIGYKYYSMGSDGYYSADAAASKSSKGEATRWGSAVGLKSNADYFRAEYITFENSFNRYVTKEEIADGVEPSGSQKITYDRTASDADVTSKTATERGAAIAVEGDYSEFYKCVFLGSQDTLYTRSSMGYYRECRIEGNTDYIFGQGTNIFQNCELQFAGYSDKATGGYITAKTNTGKYLFYDCTVTADDKLKVGSGYFGRPWSSDADVAFVNTKLQYESIITAAGWHTMSGNSPENANYKEYNTTANGKAVDTSGRISGTVVSSGSGLDVNTYLNGWEPYYLNYTYTPPAPVVIEGGKLITQLTVHDADTSSSWSVDTDIQQGDKVFGDRDYTYASLPFGLFGGEAILTACNSKNYTDDVLAEFIAGDNIDVYAAVDTRLTSVPGWLGTWTDTGKEAADNLGVTYRLYKLTVSSGDTVTLGSNGQSKGCTNYTVLAALQGTPLAELLPTGDVNSDGSINIFDLTLMKKGGLSEDAEFFADVNGDNAFDVNDIKLMADYIIGKDVSFAVKEKLSEPSVDDNNDNSSGGNDTPEDDNNTDDSNTTQPDIPSDAIYAAANGSSSGKGTEASPYDIATAVSKVSSGGTICLSAGTYNLSSTLKVTSSGKSAENRTTIMSYNGKVTLDFSGQSVSSSSRGVSQNADYWHWYGVEIKNAGDNGMIVGGSNNVIELCRFENNQDTGLQISATGDVWPANNLILNCTSCNNCDDASMENADGFAAKLTCSDGNTFDGCISYNNSDDGWDLFAKTATGPIGVVTLRNCVAFRNGYTEDGRGYGDCDGNGFKLGGSGIGSPHIVENCIAFENWHCGFVDNNNPDLYGLKNCTSYNNAMDGGSNFRMYRATAGTYSGLVSYKGKYTLDKDTFQGSIADSVYYYNSTYYQVDSKTSVSSNAVGSSISGPTDSDFISLSIPAMNKVDFHEYWRNEDGSVNTQGYLEISSSSNFYGKGAVLK